MKSFLSGVIQESQVLSMCGGYSDHIRREACGVEVGFCDALLMGTAAGCEHSLRATGSVLLNGCLLDIMGFKNSKYSVGS